MSANWIRAVKEDAAVKRYQNGNILCHVSTYFRQNYPQSIHRRPQGREKGRPFSYQMHAARRRAIGAEEGVPCRRPRCHGALACLRRAHNEVGAERSVRRRSAARSRPNGARVAARCPKCAALNVTPPPERFPKPGNADEDRNSERGRISDGWPAKFELEVACHVF